MGASVSVAKDAQYSVVVPGSEATGTIESVHICPSRAYGVLRVPVPGALAVCRSRVVGSPASFSRLVGGRHSSVN